MNFVNSPVSSKLPAQFRAHFFPNARNFLDCSQENLRKHVLSTNKHPGKCIYECKFCDDDTPESEQRFQTNFAKDFKAHLVGRHSDTFQSGAAAATYVSGIYEAQHDSTNVAEDLGEERLVSMRSF